MQKQYEMIETIFKDILPKEGFLVREEQIKLCKQICSSLYNRKISLSEAEVGIGKTLAYLIACIVNSVITSYSIHYTKLYEFLSKRRTNKTM